ncbi:hypothetical protein [Ancylobacter terrae]|uniref:hypothetical protein n=1 Tax=Ancylobacter sp. sgz301288 TaxID=3342077 RepID=UPI00385CA69C
MTDKDELLPAWPNAALLLSSLSLVVALVFAGLAGYLTVEVMTLNREVAQLKQGRFAAAADAGATEAPAAPAPTDAEPAPAWIGGGARSAPAEPAASVAEPQPQPQPAPAETSAATAAPSEPSPAPEPATADAAPGAPSTAQPVTPKPEPAPVYSARVFVPAGMDKAKLDRFTGAVKGAGIADVGITEDPVGQPESSSMLYHSSAAATAKKIAAALKARYPGLEIEMRESQTISPNAWNIVIINLTADAVK